MSRDKVAAIDSLFVGLESQGPATPRHPCEACGKETKEHHAEERTLEGGAVATIPRRICSAKACREIYYPTATGRGLS